MTLNPLTLIRRRAYKAAFSGPEGRKVLADLRRFCRATMPTADVNNTNTTYLLEGRREVFLRILSHLNLDEEDVYKLIEEYPQE